MCYCIGRKINVNAEAESEELVDPPKIEDKLGAVPHGLSTDSDVAKRLSIDASYTSFCELLAYFSWCVSDLSS